MENILLALTIIVGIGVLVMVIVLGIIGGAVLYARKRVARLFDQYEKEVAPHVAPLAQSARNLVDDLSPKIKHISTNAVEVSDILRSETQHITVSVSDVVERTHLQAARVDNIVANALNGIGHVTESVQQSLATPMRHFNGIVEGIRAGVGSFRRRRPSPSRHENGVAATVVIRQTEEERPASNA